MNLSYKEKNFLALYLEFFNRYYDIHDDRESSRKNVFRRHIEMQNIIYLLSTMNIMENYGFVWDFCGPFSLDMQEILVRLDKKEREIMEFYESYLASRNGANYLTQLENSLIKYFDEYSIKKIAMASFTLEEVLSQDNGSEALARILYVSLSRLPGADFERVVEEFNKLKNYKLDEKLAEKIWRGCMLIGISNFCGKVPIRTRKSPEES